MRKEKKSSGMTRRDFVGRSVAAVAGFSIVPSTVVSGLGHKAPSDKLNIAGIGIGGMGRTNLRHCATENIVALCDVDWKYADKTFKDYPKAKKYWDWRKMYDEMKDGIDAVVIATADHSHAITAAHAITMGKHVYLQKPLTHTVYESRLLTKLARKYKVVTQMGNQGNSGEGIRQTTEWLQSGVIGPIRKVHTWTNRPIWPQGLERPTEKVKVPKTLNWDLFLGTAPERPYNPIYTPWNWRGWWDFGTGALGDMACHIIDPAYKALNLGRPIQVQASSTQINTESAPHAEMIQYYFPARENLPNLAMPEVEVIWYDGGLMPERPEELPDGMMLGDPGGGCLFEGEKGKLVCGTYGVNPMLLPPNRMDDFEPPKPWLRRPEETTGLKWNEGGHEQDWIRACKESPENRVLPSSNFDYAGPFNEMVVMGVVAVRLQDLKRILDWDGEDMKFTNIGDNDEIRVVTTDKFEIIDGDPKFETKHATLNAKKMAEELIRHTYRGSYTLPEMPA